MSVADAWGGSAARSSDAATRPLIVTVGKVTSHVTCHMQHTSHVTCPTCRKGEEGDPRPQDVAAAEGGRGGGGYCDGGEDGRAEGGGRCLVWELKSGMSSARSAFCFCE